MRLPKKQKEKNIKLANRLEELESLAWNNYQDIHGFEVAFLALREEQQKEYRKIYKKYFNANCPY